MLLGLHMDTHTRTRTRVLSYTCTFAPYCCVTKQPKFSGLTLMLEIQDSVYLDLFHRRPDGLIDLKIYNSIYISQLTAGCSCISVATTLPHCLACLGIHSHLDDRWFLSECLGQERQAKTASYLWPCFIAHAVLKASFRAISNSVQKGSDCV